MGRKRRLIMNTIKKILFWVFAITVGFVNPLITFGLIILYYLPRVIQDLCQPCNEEQETEMNSFSKEILEDMK